MGATEAQFSMVYAAYGDCCWSEAMAEIVRFDGYQVDLLAGQLLKNGIRITLRDQSFQVLIALLEYPGKVVTRDDLRRTTLAERRVR